MHKSPQVFLEEKRGIFKRESQILFQMFLIFKIKCRESKWHGLIRPNHDNQMALPLWEEMSVRTGF
jgi:hypothetical protein